MLSAVQLEHFTKHGFLMVDSLLEPENDLEPVADEFESVLGRLAKELYEKKLICSLYDNLAFGERLTKITLETGKSWARYFSPYLPPRNTEKDTPFSTGPAIFNVIRNDRIADLLESVIGCEIFASPIQNVRLKIPEHLQPRDPKTGKVLEGATPWHQDGAFFGPEVDEVKMVTVWLPLSDVSVKNGCLAVLPGSHREGLRVHCPEGTKVNPSGLARVPEKIFDLNAMVPVPMKRGDALVFDRRLIHGSLPNHSNSLRWSLDLRYLPTGMATGYPQLPGFVIRSQGDPKTELHDAVAWNNMWLDCRADLIANPVPPLHQRWDNDDPVCN